MQPKDATKVHVLERFPSGNIKGRDESGDYLRRAFYLSLEEMDHKTRKRSLSLSTIMTIDLA
jgi:hypothetical protein